MTDFLRKPHAALDAAGRLPKAEKIFRLLNPPVFCDRPTRVLEVGTGSGMIAHYFGAQLGDRGQTVAVDVVDQRVVQDGYEFSLVNGTGLPFADSSFDCLISNHVIEHVGNRDAQRSHLRELARVLREDGKGYLAVPSRWQIVEPHYHIAFLSWLPRAVRTPYLRARGKGGFYDCEPLRRGKLEELFSDCGLASKNMFGQALRALVEVEDTPSLPLRMIAALPEAVLDAVCSLSPTHIYLFAKRGGILSNEG